MTRSKRKYLGLNPLPPDFATDHPPLAFVIEEACIGCDRCIPLCFFDALTMIIKPKHKYKRVAAVEPDNCTGCGLCFEACPTDAFIWVPDKACDRLNEKIDTGLEDRDL